MHGWSTAKSNSMAPVILPFLKEFPESNLGTIKYQSISTRSFILFCNYSDFKSVFLNYAIFAKDGNPPCRQTKF